MLKLKVIEIPDDSLELCKNIIKEARLIIQSGIIDSQQSYDILIKKYTKEEIDFAVYVSNYANKRCTFVHPLALLLLFINAKNIGSCIVLIPSGFIYAIYTIISLISTIILLCTYNYIINECKYKKYLRQVFKDIE